MQQTLTPEKLIHLNNLVAMHKRRLYLLEGQAASYGIDCPVHIITDIEDTKAKIETFEQQIKSDVIGSYDKGRDILEQFTNSIQGIEQNLRNVVIKEKRTFRLFGIPIWSTESARVVNLFIVIISVGIGFLLGGGVVSRTAVEIVPTSIPPPTQESQLPSTPPPQPPPSPPPTASPTSDNSSTGGSGAGGGDCGSRAFVSGTGKSGLRVRTLPSQNGQVLVIIPEGGKVTLQCQELGGWVRLSFEIQDGEVTGWADASFIQRMLSSTECVQTTIATRSTITPSPSITSSSSINQTHPTPTEFNLDATLTPKPTAKP